MYTTLYHMCKLWWYTINLSRWILSYWSFSNCDMGWYGPPWKSLEINHSMSRPEHYIANYLIQPLTHQITGKSSWLAYNLLTTQTTLDYQTNADNHTLWRYGLSLHLGAFSKFLAPLVTSPPLNPNKSMVRMHFRESHTTLVHHHPFGPW
jgi:hypothetical protein